MILASKANEGTEDSLGGIGGGCLGKHLEPSIRICGGCGTYEVALGAAEALYTRLTVEHV